MTSKANYTLVGAFVLFLGAAFIWAVLWISAGGPPQHLDYYLVYMSESVSGLNVDAPLKFRGVDVGKVEQISVDSADPERIRLLLQVRQGTPITTDTVATLEYQGLTGIANINLSGGQIGSQPLRALPGEEYPVIDSQPSLFARLDATMSDLLANVIQTSARINALLNDENRANISHSIEHVAVLTGRLAKQSGQLQSAISNLNATLENTKMASAGLPTLLQSISQGADSVTSMAEQIRVVGENFAAASADIERTVNAGGDDLLYFTSTTLPEIAATVAEMRVASENLRHVTEVVAQDPSVLLYGRPDSRLGPGE